MNPGKMAGANRALTKPRDWDVAKQGECCTLPVLDTGIFMQSAWYPSPEELMLLNAGHPVVLQIWSRSHPPVSIGVAMNRDAAEMMCEHGGTLAEGCEVCDLEAQRETTLIVPPEKKQ